ncbi:MAG TPA: hypothetical protein VGK19_26080 [Capsulimonadaceae bacterium]|jgi:hypothetical protein
MKTQKYNFIRLAIIFMLVGQLALQSVATAQVLMICGKVSMQPSRCAAMQAPMAHCSTMGSMKCCRHHAGGTLKHTFGAYQAMPTIASASSGCQTVTNISTTDRPAVTSQARQWALGATAAHALPSATQIVAAPATTAASVTPCCTPERFHLLLIRSHGLRAPPTS